MSSPLAPCVRNPTCSTASKPSFGVRLTFLTRSTAPSRRHAHLTPSSTARRNALTPQAERNRPPPRLPAARQ
eukprot:242200-Pleurochrysis_carterae.AAC.1